MNQVKLSIKHGRKREEKKKIRENKHRHLEHASVSGEFSLTLYGIILEEVHQQRKKAYNIRGWWVAWCLRVTQKMWRKLEKGLLASDPGMMWILFPSLWSQHTVCLLGISFKSFHFYKCCLFICCLWNGFVHKAWVI